MKDPLLLADLSQSLLFAGDLKAHVMAQLTRNAGATCFLDNAIRPPLECGNSKPFRDLLLVMERFDDRHLKKLAQEIMSKLGIKQLRITTGANIRIYYSYVRMYVA